MRFISILHGLSAFSILGILYIFYQQYSVGFQSTLLTLWEGTRLVVFGDEWSDTGTYRVSPPPLSSAITRDPDRGGLWIEMVCKKLACNLIDNFACSLPTRSDNDSVGAVVDGDSYSRAMKGKSIDGTLSDLRIQVQQFLKYDKARPSIGSQTVFTVFFGLWDVLEYSTLELNDAMRAIDNSIAALFSQLDILTKYAPAHMKFLLPQMIDITFVPRFLEMTPRESENFVEQQQKGAFLTAYWNAVLFRGASQWKHGKIYMPDLNVIVMDQIRAKQLPFYSNGDTDVPVKRRPAIEHVEQPCLITLSDGDTRHLQAAAVERCSDSTTHLFWDELQFGAVAHELIGEQAASLIRSNATVASEVALEVSSISIQRDRGTFDMSYPPGY